MSGPSRMRRVLETIRGDFKERTWLAFRRNVVDGVRVKDVAAELGMTAAAVCMCRTRVVRRLRETLEEMGELPGE